MRVIISWVCLRLEQLQSYLINGRRARFQEELKPFLVLHDKKLYDIEDLGRKWVERWLYRCTENGYGLEVLRIEGNGFEIRLLQFHYESDFGWVHECVLEDLLELGGRGIYLSSSAIEVIIYDLFQRIRELKSHTEVMTT